MKHKILTYEEVIERVDCSYVRLIPEGKYCQGIKCYECPFWKFGSCTIDGQAYKKSKEIIEKRNLEKLDKLFGK
jgi:hypothetical protein